MQTVFLFPGQGAQSEGMLRRMNNGDVASASALREAGSVLNEPAASLDTAAKLASTAYVQLCILIAGVISARRLIARGTKPDYVAGHSIGAFTAAVISGVLSFSDALALVFMRGKLMQQAYPQGYGMAALVGLSENRINKEIAAFNKSNDHVYLANINTADQMVIAGKTDSLHQFISSLPAADLQKAKLLHLSVPSHCELLAGVSTVLKEKLASVVISEPRFPYVSNYGGRLLRSAEAIREDLSRSVANTVRWYDGISLLYELGARIFIEMQPSGVLSKITESSFPQARVIPVQDNHTDAAAWIWQHYQEEIF